MHRASDSDGNIDNIKADIGSVTNMHRRQAKTKPIVITVDGGIGSGKSTTLEQLKVAFADMPNVHFIQEPVDTVWNAVVDEHGETILSNFYRDPKTYAFKFQMMAYISRLSILLAAARNPAYDVIITERCVETDRNVFEKMMHAQGFIGKDDHTIYNMWFDEFYDDVRATGIVYIQASAETCLARIKKRAREGESIALEYLAECNKYHDDWILNDSRRKLVIDADKDTVSDQAAIDSKIFNIATFVLSVVSVDKIDR